MDTDIRSAAHERLHESQSPLLTDGIGGEVGDISTLGFHVSGLCTDKIGHMLDAIAEERHEYFSEVGSSRDDLKGFLSTTQFHFKLFELLLAPPQILGLFIRATSPSDSW